DRVRILQEAGEVVLVAGRREGAGHREQHNGLAVEDLAGLAIGRAVRRHHLEGCVRKLVAHLDAHLKSSAAFASETGSQTYPIEPSVRPSGACFDFAAVNDAPSWT